MAGGVHLCLSADTKTLVSREKFKLIQVYTRFSCFIWLKNKSAPGWALMLEGCGEAQST
jgi:heme/copper-type cytochrome/quinol oxidase subunit 4